MSFRAHFIDKTLSRMQVYYWRNSLKEGRT